MSHPSRLLVLALGSAINAAAHAQPPAKPSLPYSPAPARATPPEPKPQADALDKKIRAELARVMARLSDGGSPSSLLVEVTRILDLHLAYNQHDRSGESLVQLAIARRTLAQLAAPKNDAAKALIPFLLANPDTAAALALAIRTEDQILEAYAVLDKLVKQFPAETADKSGNASLIAALCVVYDKPPAHPTLPRRSAPAIDPAGVFTYFRTHPKLPFAGRLPTELLVHLVDRHASETDARWAMQNYAGNQTVGKLFDSITYDTAALKYGREKKIFAEKTGYTLANIKRVGGVCAEQAYFASEVAKAIGVPSVYITGDGSDLDHAWVGYLRNRSGRLVWDFTEGRFGDYQHTQGRVMHPQTNRVTSDAFIGLTEWIAAATPAAARLAIARGDAAAHLMQLAEKPGSFPPAWPGDEWGSSGGETPAVLRTADITSALAILREALTACAGHEPAWQLLGEWSTKGLLSSSQKREWSEAVIKMAGATRPDFALAMLHPMFASIEDAAEQSRMWDWAASQFHRRPDLVSAARVSQGKCWEKAGDNARAWAAYQDVITRFANEGSSVLAALAQCEDLLNRTNKREAALGLYEEAFRRISKPSNMSPGFANGSNYYRVGHRYSMLLEQAGRNGDSARVRRQIGVVEEPAGK